MRLWILGILLLVLLVVLLRAAFWGRPDPVSGRRFPRFTVITLVIIIGVIGWFEWRWRDMQQQATIVVQQVIQRHDASVECQRTGAALLFAGNESGHVIYEEGDHLNTGSVALLAYETCGDLGSWLRSDKTNSTPKRLSPYTFSPMKQST